MVFIPHSEALLLSPVTAAKGSYDVGSIGDVWAATEKLPGYDSVLVRESNDISYEHSSEL